jgi:signal transduction histidine kinase
VVRDVLRLLREEREGRDVRLRLDPLPPCLADRALLKQVYQNLIANALKFTRPCKRAEIQVGFKQINGQGAYFVRDNGVGLDTSNPASIFNSFHRLKNARPFEGSGIGLSLVKRIVERHDGHVWAEGEAGRGAAIYFVLSDTPQAGRTIRS